MKSRLSIVRQRRAQYQRHYKSDGFITRTVNVDVPDDVQRFDSEPSPCFRCESRGPCRHRPWMVAS